MFPFDDVIMLPWNEPRTTSHGKQAYKRTETGSYDVVNDSNELQSNELQMVHALGNGWGGV